MFGLIGKMYMFLGTNVEEQTGSDPNISPFMWTFLEILPLAEVCIHLCLYILHDFRNPVLP